MRQGAVEYPEIENVKLPAGGSDRSFEKIILPHVDSLYGAAYRLTRRSSDAEDLVQDTMLRAYTRFESFRADGSPRAWLLTIMRNIFINAYRKKSREPLAVSLESVEDPGLHNTWKWNGGMPGYRETDSPERTVLSQMEAAALLRAVSDLPEDYRQVVILADIDGLSYIDIAERLGVPVGTVRSRLNRGRRRVQRALYAWRSSETAFSLPSAERQPIHA